MSFRLHPDQDALFLDIDGTLLDIASTPGGVIVPQSLLGNLARLHEKLGGALALISGRTLEDIDVLFSPLHLPASGVHGAELRIEMEKEARESLPDELKRKILGACAPHPALIVEDKKYSMAVHYRQAPELENKIEKLMRDNVSDAEYPLSIIRGKMVFEIAYPWHNKGAALECFMTHAPFAGRRPVFFGDDETDVFAINVCQQRDGIGVKVGVKEFPSPYAVRRWIGAEAESKERRHNHG